MPDTLKQDTPSPLPRHTSWRSTTKPYVRDLACRWLKGAGHICGQAANADAAWAAIFQQRRRAPGGAGRQHAGPFRLGTVRRRQERRIPNTAVLMMTATRRDQDGRSRR